MRINREMNWRNNLQVGDRLDAIKTFMNSHSKIQGWVRGKIHKYLNDDPTSFLIDFDNQPMQSMQ